MHSLELVKPDGRALTLYARAEIAPVADVPSPFREPLASKAHLRWHPLRGEWITYAAYRQGRTFQPPPQYNSLAVTTECRSTPHDPGDVRVAVVDLATGALRDLTGGFTAIWGTLTVLMIAQIAFSAVLRPGLRKVE